MTPAEIRELVAYVNETGGHTANAADMRQAATALTEILARCERMEEALREIGWSDDENWRTDRARAALSGGE